MLRLASLTTVLALAACANQGDEGFIVLSNTAATTSCSFSGDPAQPFIAHGEIWTGSPHGYVLTPLLQSRISSSGIGSAGTIDPTTRTIYLKGANVDLAVKAVSIEHADHTFATASVTLPSDLAKVSTLFSAPLPPSGYVNVSFEMIPVQMICVILTSSGAGDTDRMRAEVLATVTMFGELNGDDVTAQPFTFPVSVCNDCVVNDLGACPTVTTPRTGNPCNMFQDGIVDCCELDGGLVCPATTGTAAK